MNPEIKERWCKALESGEYKQTKSYLSKFDRGEYRYCCLGVLCDLYAEEHEEEWDEPQFQNKNESQRCFLDEETELPPEVADWALLDSLDPYVGQFTLIQLNDEEGSDFKDIARKIRRYL